MYQLIIDIISVRENSQDKTRLVLDAIWNKFGKIAPYLVSNSSPMSRSDKIGLTLTVIAFGLILFPLATSDSDPYHIKWILDEVTENVSFIEVVDKSNDSHYRIIAHLKISQETHLDTTEKIILGKYRAVTD